MPPRTAAQPPGKCLTEEQFAEFMQVDVETVRKWRKQKTGPDPFKGDGRQGTVRYPEAWIYQWLESRRVRHDQPA